MKHNNRLWVYELADAKFEYCFLSGKFRYRACSLNQKHRWGTIAGSVKSCGYRQLRVKIGNETIKIYEHRLAVYLNTGKMPSDVVHHIDGNRSNNRIINLQACSKRYNSSVDQWKLGKTSKYTGVYWNKASSKWKASIKLNGKQIHLGMFKSEKKAAAAYQKALQGLEVN